MGQKQLGQLHSYSVNFEAVYAVDQAIIGWNDLKDLGRSRQIMDWSMVNLDTNEGDAGEGFTMFGRKMMEFMLMMVVMNMYL